MPNCASKCTYIIQAYYNCTKAGWITYTATQMGSGAGGYYENLGDEGESSYPDTWNTATHQGRLKDSRGTGRHAIYTTCPGTKCLASGTNTWV